MQCFFAALSLFIFISFSLCVCVCVCVWALWYFTLPARHVSQISVAMRAASLMNLSRVGIALHIRPVTGKWLWLWLKLLGSHFGKSHYYFKASFSFFLLFFSCKLCAFNVYGPRLEIECCLSVPTPDRCHEQAAQADYVVTTLLPLPLFVAAVVVIKGCLDGTLSLPCKTLKFDSF